MWWFIVALVLPGCMAAAWLILRLTYRRVFEDARFERARHHFHARREWLEAGFLSRLARDDPFERDRWEDAHWHDEIVWARDRKTRHLLALIGVHFDVDPFEADADQPPRHATVVFEYQGGRWRDDSKRLDEISPDEAFLRHRRFEPVVLPEPGA